VPIVLCGFFILLIALAQFTAWRRTYYEKTNTARYNLKLLGAVISRYAEDNDGYLPDAKQWCDLLMKYDSTLSEDNFKHPKLKGFVIAFNKNLDNLRLSNIPDDVVLLFEAQGRLNLSGGAELLTSENVNRDRIDVLFINNDIKTYWVKREGIRTYGDVFLPLRWKQ